jgi:2-C-methyl-D-erythritol 4-phosphate cytidylyltransferase
MRCWVVVPAAGIGRRMGVHVPKQYLALCGRTVIEHSLEPLRAHPRIDGIVLGLAPDDAYWEKLRWRCEKPWMRVTGGSERCHTVLYALDALSEWAEPEDWVLVHDAARPCLRTEDLSHLIDVLEGHAIGGLLGLPVCDTVKRADAQGTVECTLERSGMWRALTPQMFRLGALRGALREAIASGALVTDESSAMEIAGLAPRLVEGHSDNIKITRPEDLALAELFLRQQGRG